MQKILIIKYAELSTKKDNIGFFIKQLKDNLKNVLKDDDVTISFDKGRMFVVSLNDYEMILSKVKKVFGIHEINIGYQLDTNDLDIIKDSILEIIKKKNFQTFKVETKRSDKTYPQKSPEISKEIGAHILKNFTNIKVDVHNPQLLVNVEIRSKKSLFYFEKETGLGGYPVSSLGKGMLMLSGGIDSPVAGFLACKRGVKIEALYFESPPHTSKQAKNKVIALAKKLSLYNLNIRLHVINFTEIQTTIYKDIPHEYLITIMRRMMYRIAEKLAKKRRCHVIVNGESIGQVASQTLTSMSVINEVVKMPVIRPVACLDKNEIIQIARQIDTYETSILPFEDCCTIFVPDHPVINPNLKTCYEYEDGIDFENMINKAIDTREEIIITPVSDNDFQSIL